MSLEKVNGERAEKIMQLLDKAGQQSRNINTEKIGPDLGHLYNEKMNKFIEQYNQALRLFDELKKDDDELKEEDKDYKVNHFEIDKKFKSTIKEFSRYEK